MILEDFCLEAVFYMRKTCNISKYIHKLGNLVVLKVLHFYCSAIAYNVELNAGPGQRPTKIGIYSLL